MTYIGIDPGVSGALCAITEEGEIVFRQPFDEGLFREVLDWLSVDRSFCVLEKVSAMPGQGVTSMFTFGQNYGYTQGLLRAFQIPFELVTPKVWKREFGLTSDKASSIETVKRLFPGVNLHRTERSRTDDNNLAEALLMAEYARRKHGGKT